MSNIFSSSDDTINSVDIITEVESLESDIEDKESEIDSLQEDLNDRNLEADFFEKEIADYEPGSCPLEKFVNSLQELQPVIATLEAQLQDANKVLVELQETLAPIKEFADKAESYSGDWNHNAVLINEDYFDTYARKVAVFEAADSTAAWPGNHIDWTAAADELKSDYSAVEFEGETFWIQ